MNSNDLELLSCIDNKLTISYMTRDIFDTRDDVYSTLDVLE